MWKSPWFSWNTAAQKNPVPHWRLRRFARILPNEFFFRERWTFESVKIAAPGWCILQILQRSRDTAISGRKSIRSVSLKADSEAGTLWNTYELQTKIYIKGPFWFSKQEMNIGTFARTQNHSTCALPSQLQLLTPFLLFHSSHGVWSAVSESAAAFKQWQQWQPNFPCIRKSVWFQYQLNLAQQTMHC